MRKNIKIFLMVQKLSPLSLTDYGRKDGQTHKSIIGHTKKVNLSRSVDFSASRATYSLVVVKLHWSIVF